MSEGIQVYNVDNHDIKGRGIKYTSDDMVKYFKDEVTNYLSDIEELEKINEKLFDFQKTDFETELITRILKTDFSKYPDWLIGEGIGIVYSQNENKCFFPWPVSRDIKSPNSSLPGADIVGFQIEEDATRFVFGEIKTSKQEKWPPNVMTSRTGMEKQLEKLRDDLDVKISLMKYLAFRATDSDWEDLFRAASTNFLTSNGQDLLLVGILIRDVSSKSKDLKQRVLNLSNGKPKCTIVQLFALYFPKNSIGEFKKKLTLEDRDL